MDQQGPEQTGDSTPAESRTEWIRPRFDRLAAGSAEASDVINTDGTLTS